MEKYPKIFVLSFMLMLGGSVFAQQNTDTLAVASTVKKDDRSPQKGTVYLTPVPIVGFNPAFDFMYGLGGTASWFMGDPQNTSISSAVLGIIFTTRNQKMVSLRSTTYTSENNWQIIGDVRYFDTSQATWGLSTGSQSSKPISGEVSLGGITYQGISNEDFMEFKLIRVYETFLHKIGYSGLYAGLGLHIDLHRGIVDSEMEENNEDVNNPSVITPYWAYTQYNGFDQDRSNTVGLSLNAVYDTRDNVNNPYDGRYLMMNFRINPQFLGSDKNSTQLNLEYRDYFNFTEDKHNILAVWGIGNFTLSGELPYLCLPAIGWDQYGTSGAPYTQGRFRGENLVYTGMEYRKHIWGSRSNPRLIGAVAFLNATTVSGGGMNDAKLFEYIAPGYGLGLRINFRKKARTNLGLDYGWGAYGSTGFFIRINENF
ncbi:MAG: BamA/TamA family outer membrane protein [Mangrovibacterium sp.]